MQRTDVEISLQEIHHKIGINDEALVMDESFRSQGYDSLDEMEFLVTAEKEFGITVDDQMLSNNETPTPNDVVDLILTAIPKEV